MCEGGVLLNDSDDVVSKVKVTTRELVCKGGEDVLELPSVEVIAGTEEAGPKESIVCDCFRERLGYCRFPGAR